MPAVFARSLASPAGYAVRGMALVFCVVMLAALFGILTRPVGFLAAVWPANAILLGLMVRNPALADARGWLAAFAGYIAADLLTGGGLLVTVWLTLANLAGVGVGFALFMRLEPEDRQLRRPISIVSLFMICTLAAAAAALAGSGAARVLFDRDIATGFAFWFTTELVNSIIVLPAMLTAPALADILSRARAVLRRSPADLYRWLPAATLLASLVASPLIGGAGAFAYPIPALLWCALSYGLFATAVVTLFFSVVQLIAVSSGLFPVLLEGDEVMASISIRLAIGLIALGPLAVASINAARDELLDRLRHAAEHDGLTGALARSAFMERGERLVRASGGNRPETAVLMIDIDRFKSVNDRFGHAVGDRVLVDTAATIAAALREGDVFGRLGGEEFAVVLAGSSRRDALLVAERIRRHVSELALEADGAALRVTVSIGVAARSGSRHSLPPLLCDADKALYRAKAAGRDRIVAADTHRSHNAGHKAA